VRRGAPVPPPTDVPSKIPPPNPTRDADPGGLAAWNLGAFVVAWLCPGLGHVLLGEVKRGVVIGVTVGGLWLGGLLIGGISVIDVKDHFGWFLGQSATAPSWVVNYLHQNLKGPGGQPPLPTGADLPYVPSYGRVHEQGVIYTALAGLLNLLCMVDVIYREPRAAEAANSREKREESGEAGAPERDGGAAT